MDRGVAVGCAMLAVIYSVIGIIVGSIFMFKGADPLSNQMNGFHSVLGTVTDAHFSATTNDDNHSGGRFHRRLKTTHIVVWVHYQFGGAVDVTDDIVNGTKNSHFKFIGGHNCRQVIDNLDYIGSQNAQSWINDHYPRGKQETIYYKPPDYSNCFDAVEINYNYSVGVTLLSLVGFCLLGLLYCIPSCLCADERHPEFLFIVFLGVIFFPITVPLGLIYSYCCPRRDKGDDGAQKGDDDDHAVVNVDDTQPGEVANDAPLAAIGNNGYIEVATSPPPTTLGPDEELCVELSASPLSAQPDVRVIPVDLPVEESAVHLQI